MRRAVDTQRWFSSTAISRDRHRIYFHAGLYGLRDLDEADRDSFEASEDGDARDKNRTYNAREMDAAIEREIEQKARARRDKRYALSQGER